MEHIEPIRSLEPKLIFISICSIRILSHFEVIDKNVQLYDRSHEDDVTACAFGDGAKFIMTSSRDSTVKLFGEEEQQMES